MIVMETADAIVVSATAVPTEVSADPWRVVKTCAFAPVGIALRSVMTATSSGGSARMRAAGSARSVGSDVDFALQSLAQEEATIR